MGNRILKESVCSSDSINLLGWMEEAFFYRLIVCCDDYGRFDARLPMLRARLFPLKALGEEELRGALSALEAAGLVRLYGVQGKPYGHILSWSRHQNVRAARSKYPPPPGEQDGNTAADGCGQAISDGGPIQSVSVSESVSESKTLSQAPGGGEEAFERLWRLYPRREGRALALKAYREAAARGVTDAQVEAGIRAYLNWLRRSGTEARYVKQGGNWFAGQCWKDDYAQASGVGRRARPRAGDYTQREYTEEELEAMTEADKLVQAAREIEAAGRAGA